MKKGKLNLPTGEIGGQKAPKLSKKEAIAAYLEILKQSKQKHNQENIAKYV